jgi:hypothetical protein
MSNHIKDFGTVLQPAIGSILWNLAILERLFDLFQDHDPSAWRAREISFLLSSKSDNVRGTDKI